MTQPRHVVQTTLSPAEFEALTRLAAERGTSNAAVLRQLVQMGAELAALDAAKIRLLVHLAQRLEAGTL